MAELSYEEMRAALQETKEKLHSRERRLRELGVDDWEPKPLPPPEKVVIKLCHHIRVNGKRCRGVATTGRDYCYFHLDDLGRRLKMARARARGQRWRLELPPLEDMYAVQVSITQVIAAMADGHIDRGLGGGMLYGLQQAATNLRLPKEVWEGSYHFDDVEEIEWAGFEKEHGVPQDFDIDTPPEEAFPPPQEPAAAVPGMVPSLGEVLVNEDDVELDVILVHQHFAQRRNHAGHSRRRLLRRRKRLLGRSVDVEVLGHAVFLLEARPLNLLDVVEVVRALPHLFGQAQVGGGLLQAVEHAAAQASVDMPIGHGRDNLRDADLHRVHIFQRRQFQTPALAAGAGPRHFQAAAKIIEVKVAVVAAGGRHPAAALSVHPNVMAELDDDLLGRRQGLGFPIVDPQLPQPPLA